MSRWFVFWMLVYLGIVMSACGKSGPAGPEGSPGVDATEPTPVQLCPGTTSFPNTFCEVLFCYQGNLYGTYSSAAAFSTEVPPGQYNSIGLNCSCTVTIGPNCQVTQ
jgi:hypothetical protein